MSGHSKWSTIKRKKGANDAKRGKLFAKLIKAIEVAAKNGGTDPSSNAALYQAISKAKSNSVPNDNIERALKRIDGDSDVGEIFELTYEGYGPHGVAILINCLTDNKNRTSSDVRAALTKNNGSMGNPGSVAYLFELKAIFQFEEYDDALVELAEKQKRKKDQATGLNMGFGNATRVVQNIGTIMDLDYNQINAEFTGDMITLNNQRSDAYANLKRTYNSLTPVYEPSMFALGLDIAGAGASYMATPRDERKFFKNYGAKSRA